MMVMVKPFRRARLAVQLCLFLLLGRERRFNDNNMARSCKMTEERPWWMKGYGRTLFHRCCRYHQFRSKTGGMSCPTEGARIAHPFQHFTPGSWSLPLRDLACGCIGQWDLGSRSWSFVELIILAEISNPARFVRHGASSM
jgi:hypothetical protein